MSHVEEHDVYNVQQGDAGQVQQVERQVLPIEYNVQQVIEEQVHQVERQLLLFRLMCSE